MEPNARNIAMYPLNDNNNERAHALLSSSPSALSPSPPANSLLSSSSSSSSSSSHGVSLSNREYDPVAVESFHLDLDEADSIDHSNNQSHAHANNHSPSSQRRDSLHDHEHDTGPLLTHYQRATSSIRKDYSTVDWYYCKYQLVRVRRLLREENLGRGWRGKLMNLFIASQGWLLLLFVGIATSLSASFIHLVAAWLGDIKTGYCTDSFFSTRRVCCMEFQVECTSWRTWSDTLSTTPSFAGFYTFNYFMYVFFSILFAVSSCYLILVYSREAAGSGIAEVKVILGGFVIKRFLGIRTLFIKSFALILAVASGLSLGKEGPLVHVAACWGNIVSRRFTKYANEVKRREILSASVAAGVSAAFGAPLGGVLFSLECVSSYFPSKTMWRSFWCAITAAILLQYFDPFQTGKLVQFALRTQSPWYWIELFPFIVLSIFGGILGAIFVRLHIRVSQWRRTSTHRLSRFFRARPLAEVFVLATITAIFNYTNFYMRNSSTTLLSQLFSSCNSQSVVDDRDINLGSASVVNALCNTTDSAAMNLTLLMLAGVLKYFLTVMTYGSRVPSGVFVPALTCGACFGRALGWLMDLWYQSVGDTQLFHLCVGKSTCIFPNVYAVIGATALLGGITRMTVSLAVIMFEVTGGLEYIVPIMVAVVCSRWVGDALSPPLYNKIIEYHGWPYIDADLESVDVPYMSGTARDIMCPHPVCLTAYSSTLKDLRTQLSQHPFHGFPIIDNSNERHCVGFIARADIEFELESNTHLNSDLEERTMGMLPIFFSDDAPPFRAPDNVVHFTQHVDKHPIMVSSDTPLERVVELFISLGLRYVLVTDRRDNRLLGLIKKKDLLLFLHASRAAENQHNDPINRYLQLPSPPPA